MVSIASSNGVNLKSGRYFRNLALFAVFLNCPSALLVSELHLLLGKVESLGHRIRHVADGDLVLLADGKNDRIRLFVQRSVEIIGLARSLE